MSSEDKLPRSVRWKNIRKGFRVVLQYLFLAAVAVLLVRTLFFPDTYVPYEASAVGAIEAVEDNGFIALSYFGVSVEGSRTLISQKRLEEHLYALKDAGFVTITQRDIVDYYYSGKALPEKALFLMFEDGRRESARLAQPILEACNFKATMLTYANNLSTLNTIFLTGNNLRSLEKSSYWEMGTHGYRLSYINVFDRHTNFLGELTPNEFVQLSPYLRREYNHFLMDFLRDEYDIPVESAAGMRERVGSDYLQVQSIYRTGLGYVPGLYAIMHANTGQFATDPNVSMENERWMTELFTMNFNREMFCLNTQEADIYDLTRMQPQAGWTANHLRMRINADTNSGMIFTRGDGALASRWELIMGAAEHTADTIYLTSEPEGIGLTQLRGSERLEGFYLEVQLDGNKLGAQSIDLWDGVSRQSYTAVEIRNNVLRIYRAQQGEGAPALEEGVDLQEVVSPEALLFELDLDKHDGVIYQTWEENRQEALSMEIPAKENQSERIEGVRQIINQLEAAQRNLNNVNREPYIPELGLLDQASRHVALTLNGGKLTVSIDHRVAAENIEIPGADGGLALRSAWGEYGYSQRNLADDVYDGVFRSLVIAPLEGGGPNLEEAIIDNRSELQQQAVEFAQTLFQRIVDWAGSKL